MNTSAQEFRFLDPGDLTDGELELVLAKTDPGDRALGWLPEYVFQMRKGGQVAGSISLRIGNTHPTIVYGGHIGYAVASEFRGNHYAERSCRLLFPLAEAHGLTHLWITCNPDNIASRRTCERLGGVLVETVSLPVDNDIYRSGERAKCRYRIDLS